MKGITLPLQQTPSLDNMNVVSGIDSLNITLQSAGIMLLGHTGPELSVTC